MKSLMQSDTPFCRFSMILWLSVGFTAMAQDVVPPASGNGKGPPPMRRPGGGAGMPGDPRFPRAGGNLSPMQMEGFERLPEEEKKRLRAAIDKAWKLPAVQEAKDRYLKASEDFRTTMRQTLKEVDPDVVKILEKLRPPQPMDPRVLPKLPPPTDNAFAKVALERLGVELMTFVKPENREKVRAIHLRVMETPEVAAAAAALLAAPPEKRIEALGKLREVYRQTISKELPNVPPKPPTRTTSADASSPAKGSAPEAPPN